MPSTRQAEAVRWFGTRAHVNPEPACPSSPLTPHFRLARTHRSHCTRHCPSQRFAK